MLELAQRSSPCLFLPTPAPAVKKPRARFNKAAQAMLAGLGFSYSLNWERAVGGNTWIFGQKEQSQKPSCQVSDFLYRVPGLRHAWQVSPSPLFFCWLGV